MTDSGHTYSNGDGSRVGNWMQTFSGRQFWPLDPRPEEIHIEDIAHALSNSCRYAGHCEMFYSVAEHSVLVSQVVPERLALVGLLHDATEAFLVDIPRPIKPFLGGYKEMEERLWQAICNRFGIWHLNHNEHLAIKEADNAVLLAEAQQIMKPHPAPWNVPGDPAHVVVQGWLPILARKRFTERFQELVA